MIFTSDLTLNRLSAVKAVERALGVVFSDRATIFVSPAGLM